MIEELAGNGVDSVAIRIVTDILIAKLIEIILEHIDDLIGLELALDPRRDSIDESV